MKILDLYIFIFIYTCILSKVGFKLLSQCVLRHVTTFRWDTKKQNHRLVHGFWKLPIKAYHHLIGMSTISEEWVWHEVRPAENAVASTATCMSCRGVCYFEQLARPVKDRDSFGGVEEFVFFGYTGQIDLGCWKIFMKRWLKLSRLIFMLVKMVKCDVIG